MIQSKCRLTVSMNTVSLSGHAVHHSQSDFVVPPHLQPAFLVLFSVEVYPQWWKMTHLLYNHCF